MQFCWTNGHISVPSSLHRKSTNSQMGDLLHVYKQIKRTENLDLTANPYTTHLVMYTGNLHKSGRGRRAIMSCAAGMGLSCMEMCDVCER